MKKIKYLLLSVMLLIVASSVYGQEPTQIPAGGTWTTARGIINTNMTQVYDSLQSLRYSTNLNYSFIESHADSITAHTAKIALRLLKSDTASMLANYTRNGELNSALAAKVNISDTAAMLAHYALTSELGDAGTSIGDVRDEIADSLNVLRPLYVAIADTATMLDPYAKLTDLSEGGIGIGAVQEEIADSLNVLRAAVTVGNGTKAPFFDGTSDGGSILYFYGSNGFYTALQGGAPIANRSYRLPIAALPSAGTTSLLNIDEYGNMGFTLNGIPSTLTATELGYSDGVTSSIQNQINAKVNVSDTASMLAHYALLSEVGGGSVTINDVRNEISDSLNSRIGAGIELSDVAVMIADSTGNAAGNYVTHKALNDSIAANLGSAVGIALNSGTLTLTGDAGTADDISFYTNGDGEYNLPAGGGNLTIMSQVQGWINDSLDVIRPLYLLVADTATMLDPYAKLTDLSAGGISLEAVQNEIADSLNAIRSASVAGIALADSTGYAPGNYVTHTQLDAFSGGSFDTTYLHYRIDSLITVVENQATEIENLWNAIETLGEFDLTAPAFLSAEIGAFADDTLVVLMDTTDVRQDSVPPLTAFTLWAGATEHGIAAVDIGHDTLYIALDSAGVYGATYTLDYTRGTPALQDSTGNKTANWLGRSVTNNIPEPEAGVPTFLTSDGYTWSWLEADAANLTLNGTQITAVNDIGPGNHDWAGNGTPGAQWDSANEEIDFAASSSANLELTTSPSTLPVTIYMVVRITDWSDGRALMYFTVPTARISQGGGTNQLLLYAGQYNLFADYTNGEYAVITATLNGATSSIQWNDDTPVTGNAGTNGISGIYLGYDQDNANFSTKEVIVRNNAESAQNIADVKAYLYSKYSITP